MNEEVFMFAGVESADPIFIEDTKPLLACRGCLASSSRPLRPLERTLAALYEDLVGPNVSPSDILPKFVCGYCHAMLLKFAKFRDRCRSSQEIFLNLHSAGITINLDLLESSGSGASYPELVKTSVQQIVLDNNVDDKFHLHNLSGNIWVSIENEQLGHSDNLDNENNDLRAFKQKCEPTSYYCSVDANDAGLQSAGNIEAINIKDEVDDCRYSEVSNQDPDTGCVAGFNSDIYEEDSKKPLKDYLSTVSKEIKKEREVKSTGITKATRAVGMDIDSDNCLATTSSNLSADMNKVVTKTLDKRKSALHSEKNTSKIVKKSRGSDLGLNETMKGFNSKMTEEKAYKTYIAGIGTLSIPATTIKKHIMLFEKKYNLKVIMLSKEDQIERLLARKDAPNYKDANFKCETCFRTFATENAFTKHMAKHDGSHGDCICDICSVGYSSKGKLKEHLWTHMFEYICNQCDTVCKYAMEASTHYKCHKGVQYDCKICGKHFRLRSSLNGHTLLSHGGSVQCTICHGKFIGSRGLNRHMRVSHKEAINSVCGDCGVQFYSVVALQRHLAAGDHSHRPCAVCGESFPNDQLLQEHQQKKHKINFDCHICGKKYATLAKLKKHLNQIHFTKYKKKPIEEGSFICEVCGTTMPTKMRLMLHTRTHTKPFQCDHCNKRFSHKHSLQNHISCLHMDKPSTTPLPATFPCQYCDRRFNCKNNRTRHENAVHLKMRPFTCTCGLEYASKATLQMHINTRHLGLPRPKRERKGPRRRVGRPRLNRADDY